MTAEPTWGIQFFWMNTEEGAARRPARAEARCALAFPYEQMIKDVMRGQRHAAAGLPFARVPHSGRVRRRRPTSRRARKLLAEARAAPGTTITIEYSFGLDFQRQAVELMAGSLRPLGIDVKIQGVTFATMFQHASDAAQRPHMFYSSADPDTADPDSFLYRTFHSKSRYWANFGFGDPKIDDAPGESPLRAEALERRAELYKQAQAMPAGGPRRRLPSFVQQTSHLLRGNVKGYKFHPPYAWGAIADDNLCRSSDGAGLGRLLVYVVQRLFWTAFLVAGITLLTFAMTNVLPGGPRPCRGRPGGPRRAGPGDAPPDGARSAAARQYLGYMTSLVHGDWGIAGRSQRPVLDEIKDHLPATLELVAASMLLGVVLGIPMGILAAFFRGTLPDRVLQTSSRALPCRHSGLRSCSRSLLPLPPAPACHRPVHDHRLAARCRFPGSTWWMRWSPGTCRPSRRRCSTWCSRR